MPPYPIVLVSSSAVAGQVVFGGSTTDTCSTLTTPYVGTPSSYVDRRTYPLYSTCTDCNGLLRRYYFLSRCDTGASAYSIANWWPTVRYSVGDRVQVPGGVLYIVTGVTETSPGNDGIEIFNTGLTGCPSTTTTTTLAPSTTTTTTLAPPPVGYCYRIISGGSIGGECFNCPGTYQSVVDWIIEFFDGCNGNPILPPVDINVVAHYEDGSTQNTFIPAGEPDTLVIATRVTSCGTPPSCTETSGPMFSYAVVTPVVGTVGVCCANLTTTTTTTSTPPPPLTTTTTTTPAPTLEWYFISSCLTGTTATSKDYPVNTYELNDRVGADGYPWRVTGIVNYNPGGANYELTATGSTGCPFVGCIKWTNEFDYDEEVTCTDPFTSVTSSGTDVYFKLTASLFELDGVTPKDAPFGGVAITFGVATSGACSTGGGGTYVVTIPAFTNSVIAEYQQTNYSECGYGCGYNTFTPESLLYTNYTYVNECPA
jgi:hypothetical protein